MIEHLHQTQLGTIHYWTNDLQSGRKNLVLLPGLTADHRLFQKQIEALSEKYNLLTWDAPGHASSRPFILTFDLEQKARWLHEILVKENFCYPVLIGQSMGGYVSQMYIQLFPGEVLGFISIDSAPLQRHYMAGWEIWSLKHTEPIYQFYPWHALKRAGARGCATTDYGRKLMAEMMGEYEHRYYAQLAGHGYRMLANAVEQDLPYQLDCPSLLICGEQDRAGSAKRYNKRWAEHSGLCIEWIPNAGHNSNTDQPELINHLIHSFVSKLRL